MSDEKKEPDLTLEKLKISEKINELKDRLTNLEHRVEIGQSSIDSLLRYLQDRTNDVYEALSKLSDFFKTTIYGEPGDDKKGIVERLAFLEGREESREKQTWVFWVPLAVGLLIGFGAIIFGGFHKEIAHLMRHWKGIH